MTQEDTLINTAKPTTRQWPLWRLTLIILNIVAFIISIILSWHYIKGGTILGCDGSGSCDQILSSQWSAIAGKIPVSGLAMGAYLTLLLANFFTDSDTEQPIRRQAWTAMLVLAGALAGIAIWFTIVQKWMIGQFCPYCMTEHTMGILMAGIIIWQGGKHLQKYKLIGLAVIGLLAAGMIAGSQIIFAPSATYQNGISGENSPKINYNEAPIVGSPNAPYVIKVLFDYQCPHCQKLHGMLKDVVSRYKGKVAFVLCPAPLSTECNPYIPYDVDAYKNSCDLAKIGMAVWASNRQAFATFDEWMFSEGADNEWQPRTLKVAREKAIELVGQIKFNEALSSSWVQQYIQTSVQLYGQTTKTGRGGVPKLLLDSNWVIPELTNVDDLIAILQKSLAVPKP